MMMLRSMVWGAGRVRDVGKQEPDNASVGQGHTASHISELEPVGRHKQFARCNKCGCRWVVAYVPMLLWKFAQVLMGAHCPQCGSESRDLVLEQTNAAA